MATDLSWISGRGLVCWLYNDPATSVMCYACLCCAIQMQRPVSELARCPAQGDQTAFVQEIGHPFMRGGGGGGGGGFPWCV